MIPKDQKNIITQCLLHGKITSQDDGSALQNELGSLQVLEK